MASDACQGLFGRLFGHKFEAQHNEKFGDGFIKWLYGIESMRGSVRGLIESGKESHYVKSVCKRCGKETGNA